MLRILGLALLFAHILVVHIQSVSAQQQPGIATGEEQPSEQIVEQGIAAAQRIIESDAAPEEVKEQAREYISEATDYLNLQQATGAEGEASGEVPTAAQVEDAADELAAQAQAQPVYSSEAYQCYEDYNTCKSSGRHRIECASFLCICIAAIFAPG